MVDRTVLRAVLRAQAAGTAPGGPAANPAVRARGRLPSACATLGRDGAGRAARRAELAERPPAIDAGGRLVVRAAGDEAVGAGDVVHVRSLETGGG